MLKWILIGLVVLCVEVVVIVALVADGAIGRAIQKEKAEATAWLGITVAARLDGRSQRWFNQRFVHNGVVGATYDYLIPDEKVRQQSGTLADVGRHDVFPYMERRLNVLWDAVRQVTYRLALLALWTPYLLPLAAIAVLDGLMRRRVKLAEFGNSSPAVHRYSLYTILALLYLLLLGLLLPLPLSPVVAPLMLGILIICINLLLANTPKRV